MLACMLSEAFSNKNINFISVAVEFYTKAANKEIP
jgi:hypothetical protein